MNTRYHIRHRTTYRGAEPISIGHNQAWLRPRDLPYQSCDEFRLRVSPSPSVLTHRLDAFGNDVATFCFNEGYEHLVVEARSVVTLTRAEASLAGTRSWNEVAQDLHRSTSDADLYALQFLYDSGLVPRLPQAADLGRDLFPAGRPIAEAGHELMQRIHAEFKFAPDATSVQTHVLQVLEKRQGVCQDFAHIMLCVLRSLGVAARYVSGYLRTIPPPGQPKLIGADASHAWVSVYCGMESGWIDFDPTNNLVPALEHITVAWGRDYADVPPLRGVYVGGSQPHLEVNVDVEPK